MEIALVVPGKVKAKGDSEERIGASNTEEWW
jgi:hypothetical protein